MGPSQIQTITNSLTLVFLCSIRGPSKSRFPAYLYLSDFDQTTNLPGARWLNICLTEPSSARCRGDVWSCLMVLPPHSNKRAGPVLNFPHTYPLTSPLRLLNPITSSPFKRRRLASLLCPLTIFHNFSTLHEAEIESLRFIQTNTLVIVTPDSYGDLPR